MNMLDRAIILATRVHAGQTRKDERNGAKLPYITHPMEVMKLVWSWGAGDEVTAASAVLHDVLEDTLCTSPELMAIDGEVYETVGQLTRLPEIPKADHMADFKDPARTSARALVIKLADRICNVRDFARFDPKYARKYLGQGGVLLEALQDRRAEVESLWNRAVYVAATHAWVDLSDELINS